MPTLAFPFASEEVRVLGLISGTSFDAVEAVAADFRVEGDPVRCALVAHRSLPFPAALREQIAGILPPAQTTIGAVCRLDADLGRFLAEVAAQVREDACGGRLDAVASHGQTVFHWVEAGAARGSLQLGQPAWIAERTGLPVVSDIRARDIAAGGQGAPLASLLDVLLLGDRPDAPRGALNIGGIANLTVVDPDRPPIAYDIGPGNALIDAAVGESTGGAEPMDLDGRRAARGRVDARLLDRLLADPYFRLEPPKSTGKELFNSAYLAGALGGRRLDIDDLVATLTMLTARTIAGEALRHGLEELVVSGGGTRNATLMARLAEALPGVAIRPSDALGVPEGAKEGLLVALVGFLTLAGRPATIPSCTGARHPSILGSITPGAAASTERPSALVLGPRMGPRG
jgi:anhydro-N-acetylmuramic acid kinase